MKVCTKCGVEKSVDMFHERTFSNGTKRPSSWCKACQNRLTAIRAANNPATVARRMEWRRTKKGQGTYRRYRANEGNKIKLQAQKKVWWAIKSGNLVRPECCTKCGERKKVQGHHRDYSKPLEVLWLCWTCHLIEHGRTIRLVPTKGGASDDDNPVLGPSDATGGKGKYGF